MRRLDCDLQVHDYGAALYLLDVAHAHIFLASDEIHMYAALATNLLTMLQKSQEIL